MRKHIFALGTVLLLSISCHREEDRFVLRKVRPEEVVGAWSVTPFALQCLKEGGHKEHLSHDDHTLLFRPDGTCHIKTVLNVILSPSNNDPRYVEREAKWDIRSGGWRFVCIFDKPGPEGYVTSYYFAEENGQLILWQCAADPDFAKYMEFVKETLPVKRRPT